jgi:hypothetical protein
MRMKRGRLDSLVVERSAAVEVIIANVLVTAATVD